MPFLYASSQKQSLPALRTYFRHDSSCVFLINSTDAIKLTVKSISSPITFKIYETENFISKRPGDTLARYGSRKFSTNSQPQWHRDTAVADGGDQPDELDHGHHHVRGQSRKRASLRSGV